MLTFLLDGKLIAEWLKYIMYVITEWKPLQFKKQLISKIKNAFILDESEILQIWGIAG